MPAIHLLRVLVLFATSTLMLTACWLLIRRFRGALQEPLSPAGLLLLGAVLAAALSASRFLRRGLTDRHTRPGQASAFVSQVIMTLAALISGISVSLPNTPVVTLVAFWALVAGSVLIAWAPVGRVRRTQEQGNRLDAGCSDRRSGALEVVDGIDRGGENASEFDERADSDDAFLPDGVSQRIVRARDERGAEVVYGTVRCEFAVGQRQQNVHIAFCPPLRSIAEFTADQVSGSAVQVKAVMVEIFGVGLEVKLASPSKEQAEVQIQFFAFEKPTNVEEA
ncbi:MAG: hypothetical protein JJ992_20185 [Planctomycetes bacterium]|nr:hypothetical protein [Planctomycetota bacterium]